MPLVFLWVFFIKFERKKMRKVSGVELSQASILEILQHSESVPLGSKIWEDEAEYRKLRAIINYSVFWTIEKMKGNENVC